MHPFDNISDSIIITSLFTFEKVKDKQLRIPLHIATEQQATTLKQVSVAENLQFIETNCTQRKPSLEWNI